MFLNPQDHHKSKEEKRHEFLQRQINVLMQQNTVLNNQFYALTKILNISEQEITNKLMELLKETTMEQEQTQEEKETTEAPQEEAAPVEATPSAETVNN